MNDKFNPDICEYCANGKKAKFIDEDGVLVSVSKSENGYWGHTCDDAFWPCPNADKIRLDFLNANAFDSVDLGFAKDGKRAVVFIAPYEGERPPDIRQAIDRAMLKAENGIEKTFVKELEK